ncbi:MAG: HEPN domain-containing protein [Parvularculales bacterium]
MESPTENYKNLKHSLNDTKKILNRVPKDQCVTLLDQLKVKSYVLLAHAAFEQYIEELVRETSHEAHLQLKQKNRICRALLSLISSEATSQVDDKKARRKINASIASNLYKFAEEAKSNLAQDIHENNGVSTNDQEKLLIPIGVDPEQVDLAVYNALHAFGKKRGEIAHKAKMKIEDTRSSVITDTNEILKGLLNFDIAACANLNEGMSKTRIE